MDDIALRKALAMLRSFGDNLPQGDIEEKYVSLYNDLLEKLQHQTENSLIDFRIPESELKSIRVTDTLGLDEPHYTDSEDRYCDRAIVLMKFSGLMNFLVSFLPDTPAKRIVGFSPPQ